MENTQSDLRRPLLQQDIDEERAVEEWNASVAAFVADDGGEDNLSCSIAPGSNVESNTSSENDGEEENSDQSIVRTELVEKIASICTSTLLPDGATGSDSLESASNGGNDENQTLPIQHQQPCVELSGMIKFLKFVVLTIGAIALVRKSVVAAGIDDRDQTLTMGEIALYEGDSILRDLMFFFVVGQMHHRKGVDTLEWIGFGLLANLYFESQNLFQWMQHAATPYEMHCLWPWQLWVFAIMVVVGSIAIGVAHAVVAREERKLWRILAEILFCFLCFVVPVTFSPYAHFHHWFAGWFLGMHANLHTKWWSRATMAYCWGMYVNGIAVYGRDPLLTCDYARFLARDQRCPIHIEEVSEFPRTFINASGGMFSLLAEVFLLFSDDPPDWRNCTSSGYHP